MSVRIAKSAGFCFGVNRAVNLVEQTAVSAENVVTLGPIIHNRHVVEHLEKLGVRVIDSPEQAQKGQTVIIRSHGVGRAVVEQLQEKGAVVVDATCPFVKRIHDLVSKAESENRFPVIIGTRTHPEVQGIAGWCSHCEIFENAGELENWLLEDPQRKDIPVTMVSQTTSTEKLWKSCEKIAKKHLSNVKISDTICRATEYRQSEAAELSSVCQAMVIVGDLTSSNTGRLAMICREPCDKAVSYTHLTLPTICSG